MSRTKTLLGVVVALAVAFSQFSLAVAAPQLDPLVGTIDSISEGTDLNGDPIIIVTYTDTEAVPEQHVVELSVEDAIALGLVTQDPETGEITILATTGTPIDLTSVTEEVDPCEPGEGGEAIVPEGTDPTVLEGEDTGDAGHPVGGALCDFFAGSLSLTYDQIMGWHEDGFGFGLIAQALWMAEMTGMDPEDILAVKGGEMDYSELGLPEGVDNWGRLRGYVFGKGAEKTVHNLGEIMSGRAEPLVTETPTESPTGEPTDEATLTSSTTTTTLQVNGHGKGGTHGKSEGKGKGKNK
jgi:hypothetical protein